MLKEPPSIIIQLLAENRVELKAALIEIYTNPDSFKRTIVASYYTEDVSRTLS